MGLFLRFRSINRIAISLPISLKATRSVGLFGFADRENPFGFKTLMGLFLRNHD